MQAKTESTNWPDGETAALDWRAQGLRYRSLNHYLQQRFGRRVQKVSIDAGFSCPNVDGSITTGGCTFCDNRSFSPSRRPLVQGVGAKHGVTVQIDDGIRRLRQRYKCDSFIAYFQPATNTYAPVAELRDLFENAIAHPQVVGLAIGTRPDCVPDDVLDLLEELAGRTWLSVEYGVQTIHNRSLEWMNRGHGYEVFPDAVERSRGRGFDICAHAILGLPGESHADMLATARELARQRIDSIKIHNLYAVKNTKFGEQLERGEVELMQRDDYVRTLVDFLELLPPAMVVERISGEAPRDFFLGPDWCLDKPAILNAINEEFTQRDTWQGKRFGQAD